MIPTSFSASALSTLELCPARYKAENIERARQPSGAAANLGTACHEALEKFVAMHGWTWGARIQKDGITGMFREAYAAQFGSDQSRYAEGLKLVLKWLERQVWTGRTVLSTEEKKSFTLKTSAGEIPFNYIMDRKDRLNNGDIEVIDYKSLSRPVQPDDLRHKLQARAYGVAAQMEHPEATRIWVSFDMLRFDAVGVVFTIEENRESYKYIKKLAEQAIEVAADPQPQEVLNSDCRWCVRKASCTALQKISQVGGTLAISDPIEAAKAAYDARCASDALKALADEYEGVVLAHMEREELVALDDVPGLNVAVSVYSRRNIDPQRLLELVGPTVMAKYSNNVTISAVDEMLKIEPLTDDVKAQVRQLIYRTYGDASLKISKSS